MGCYNAEPYHTLYGTGFGVWSVTITHALAPICLTNRKKCSNYVRFRIPFKPRGLKMGKTVGYSNTPREARLRRHVAERFRAGGLQVVPEVRTVRCEHVLAELPQEKVPERGRPRDRGAAGREA